MQTIDQANPYCCDEMAKWAFKGTGTRGLSIQHADYHSWWIEMEWSVPDGSYIEQMDIAYCPFCGSKLRNDKLINGRWVDADD